MTTQMVTLDLPEPIYLRLRERAAQMRRTIEEEARETLVSAVSEQDALPDDLEAAIAPMTLLTDAELWQAGRVQLPDDVVAQIEALHFKRQNQGLTDDEAATAAALVRQYERAMLIRAQAAALLKQRGHDMALAQMTYLNDAALWQAARTTMVEAQRERMEELNAKQQREGLIKTEEEEVQSLLTLYRETILVRAQAAVLLKQRGYDVSDPLQFAPRV